MPLKNFGFIELLILITLPLIFFGCSKPSVVAPKKDPNLKRKFAVELSSMTNKAIKKIDDKGSFDVPGGKVAEAKITLSSNAKLIIQFDKKNDELLYAGLGEITDFRKTDSASVIKTTREIAKQFAVNNKSSFGGFTFVDSNKGLNWPKPGYITYIWQKNSNKAFFAKITIDTKDGKVVSYGKGNTGWSIFCIPPGVI